MATHVGLETVERRTAVTIQDPTHTTPPTPPPPPTNKQAVRKFTPHLVWVFIILSIISWTANQKLVEFPISLVLSS